MLGVCVLEIARLVCDAGCLCSWDCTACLHVYCYSAGVIQPTKISDEGKPVPIEHVAELLEGLQTTEQNPPPSQTDSDWTLTTFVCRVNTCAQPLLTKKSCISVVRCSSVFIDRSSAVRAFMPNSHSLCFLYANQSLHWSSFMLMDSLLSVSKMCSSYHSARLDPNLDSRLQCE